MILASPPAYLIYMGDTYCASGCSSGSKVVTIVVIRVELAGVRYSKINPVTYGEANVMCTIRLLEQAKMVKPVPPVILYASSSSVYGRNVSIPFKETAVTNKPISIYAATKLATEHVAHAYHSLYNMRITGLRFFTVYGPMGRPDMAAWMWAKNISNGDALTLYEVSGAAAGGRGGECVLVDPFGLLRDFTFIDDIVMGVVLAIEYSADYAIFNLARYSADYAIFNLGRGQPQNVSLLIRMLEAELGKKALILRNPLPAGDVAVTFADTSLARKCLGYEPKVSIKEGVRSFVKWFKQYSPPKLPRNLTYVNIDPDSHPGSLGIVA
eukprot:jgi/Bigna1/89544/estExt_fgenesh1_pg.C_510082